MQLFTAQFARRPARWLAVLGAVAGLWLAGCGKGEPPKAAAPNTAAKPKASTNAPAAKTASGAMAASGTDHAANPDPSGQSSSFEDDPAKGRDPFFPKSARRAKQAATTNEVEVAAAPAEPASNFLKLTGLWPIKKRPLALINKTTFAKGEKGAVTVEMPKGQGPTKVQIECVEIRRDSVLIRVEGEPGTKELRLPELP